MEFLKIMVFMKNHEKNDFLEIDSGSRMNVPVCLEWFVTYFFNALKCFTGFSQTNGVPRRFPAFVLASVRTYVRPYVTKHLPSSILLKICEELELICLRLPSKYFLYRSNSEKVTALAVRWSDTHGDGWSLNFFDDPFIFII